MKVLNSILSSMDDIIHEGNVLVDPFYRLDVKSIKQGESNNILLFIKQIIDKDKLYECSNEFNYNNWKHLTYTNEFINNTEESNELILRFLWYICNRLINKIDKNKFRPLKVDYSNIMINDKLYINTNLYIFIQSNIHDYTLEFVCLTGTLARIKFKDNSRL